MNQEESQENLPTGGSSSALASPPCTNHSLPPEEVPPHCIRPERTWPSFPATIPDPLFENVGKEEILRRKADSLGLLSHKWAKSFLERGFMNGSLPHTFYHNLSRPISREQNRQASSDNRGTENSSTTRRERNKKMERLESVYGGRQQRNKSSRKQHSDDSHSMKDNLNSSGITSTPSSRPPTRRDMTHSTALHKLTHRVREAHQSSRPTTRADRHHRTPVSAHRRLHRWKTGGEDAGDGTATITPSQLLEGVLGVNHQQC